MHGKDIEAQKIYFWGSIPDKPSWPWGSKWQPLAKQILWDPGFSTIRRCPTAPGQGNEKSNPGYLACEEDEALRHLKFQGFSDYPSFSNFLQDKHVTVGLTL